jgi:putative transposase
MDLATALTPSVGIAPLCRALGPPRASFCPHVRLDAMTEEALSAAERGRARPRTLDSEERQAIWDTLHSTRFQDRSPTEVDATLLDVGIYLASERTIYRLLAAMVRPPSAAISSATQLITCPYS